MSKRDKPEPRPGMGSFQYEPIPGSPSMVYVERAMQALRREFTADPQVPRFVIVVETPPEGDIGIGSTGDDAVDTHRMLGLGAGATRAGMTESDKRRARAQWEAMRAGFERRN